MHEKIFIDGKEYVVNFDFNAVCDIQEYTGHSVIDFITNSRSSGFGGVRALLWGALKEQIEGLTIKQVGELIQTYLQEDENDLAGLIDKINTALAKSGILTKKIKDKNSKNVKPERDTKK